jgi:phenylacetate-CoA ligase
MASGGAFHDLAAEKLSASALEDLQQRKLQTLLQVIVGTNKFYKAKFKTGGIKQADLASTTLTQLPFTTKQELIADQTRHPPFGSNLTFAINDYTRFHQTSGSTGNPMRWLDTPASWDGIVQNWSSIYHAAGVKPKDRICFAFSFGPFLGFWSAFEAAAKYGAMCFPAGGLSTSARLRFMLDNGITVVCCTPTYALRMGEVAAEERVNIALSPVRMLIVAGEPGGSVPQTRARIEDMWGARCIDHYGMTEIGPTCFECEKTPRRLHVIGSEYIAECIDPKSNKAVADGETGELVVTGLGRAASPLLRYRTGDIVKFSRTEPCACGRSFISLDGGILGRTDDMLLIRGVNVYPSAIEEIIRRVPGVAEYRVEVLNVRAMHELKITLEPEKGESGSVLVKKLSAEMDRALGLRVNVDLATTGSLPRFEMKARRWIRSKDE